MQGCREGDEQRENIHALGRIFWVHLPHVLQVPDVPFWFDLHMKSEWCCFYQAKYVTGNKSCEQKFCKCNEISNYVTDLIIAMLWNNKYTDAVCACVGVYLNMHHAHNDVMSPGKDMVSTDARHQTHPLHTRPHRLTNKHTHTSG